MKLDFVLCEINKQNRLWDIVKKNNDVNEFIIVGEEKSRVGDHYKVIQCTNDGVRLIGGLLLDEAAYTVKKEDVYPKKDRLPGKIIVEFDVPKEYLTLDIVSAVQKLNS